MVVSFYNNIGVKCRTETEGEFTYSTLHPNFLKEIAHHLQITSESIILDIGSGHGLLLLYFLIFHGSYCIGVEKHLQTYNDSCHLYNFLCKHSPSFLKAKLESLLTLQLVCTLDYYTLNNYLFREILQKLIHWVLIWHILHTYSL